MHLLTLAICVFIGQTVLISGENHPTPKSTTTPIIISPSRVPNQKLNSQSPGPPLLPSSPGNILNASLSSLDSLSTLSDAVQSTALLTSTIVVASSELSGTNGLHDLTSFTTPESTAAGAPTASAVFTTAVISPTGSTAFPTAPSASSDTSSGTTSPSTTSSGTTSSGTTSPGTTSPGTTSPNTTSPNTTSTGTTSSPPVTSGASTSSIKPTPVSSPTKVTPTSPPVPQKPVKISETDILLNPDVFLEIEGPSGAQAQNVSLVIQDASQPYTGKGTVWPVQGTFNGDGYLLTNLSDKLKPSFMNWTCVLIVLLDSSNNSILDSLLYSTSAAQKINGGINEKFSMKYNLIVDPKNFQNVRLSFSRCSSLSSSEGFVLTKPSKNEKNDCNLTFPMDLEMKMTSSMLACETNLPNDFNNTLARNIISGVNGKKSCGLSWGMIKKFQVNLECPTDKMLEVKVRFTVTSAFPKQLHDVEEGYKSLLSDKSLDLNDHHVWDMDNCTHNCFPSIKPPKNDEDDKIRVTVAVVVSCIGVFLIVLIAVVIYMKNKRNRILQFRMTRLDDDEDELIGDLDDFLGSQAPTFHR